MRVLRAASLFVILAFLPACTECERRACECAAPNPNAEVLKATLQDLLNRRENSPISPFPGVLRVSVEPFRAEHNRWQEPESKYRWEKLTDLERALAEEAYTDMVGRAQAPETFEGFTPADKRIRLQSHSEWEKERTRTTSDIYDFPSPISAWLTGFSKDKRHAVLRMLVPWSEHHAGVLFYLVKERDRWRVLSRTHIGYP